MSEKYGVSPTSIRKHAVKIGYDFKEVTKRTGKLSEEDKKEILDAYYTQVTSTELAKKFNVSRGMITKLWHDNKLKGKESRIYKFKNKNFFKDITTEEQAYLLGFLCADGCIYQPKDNHSEIIRFAISLKDIEILEYYRKYLKTNEPIHTEKRDEQHEYVSLELSSQKMFNDLWNLNIEPRKTYDNCWVKLKNNELQLAFIRGYFDGDGCISKNFDISSLSRVNVPISGFQHNLNYFITFLKSLGLDTKFKKDNRKEEGKPFGELTFTDKNNKKRFLELIYPKNAKLYLTRKYVLAQKFIQLCEENPKTWKLK